MKNLAVITHDELRLLAPSIPVSTVKSLIKACADTIAGLRLDKKKGMALEVGELMLGDLLRKEAILSGELVRRGYHNQKDSESFLKWRNDGKT